MLPKTWRVNKKKEEKSGKQKIQNTSETKILSDFLVKENFIAKSCATGRKNNQRTQRSRRASTGKMESASSPDVFEYTKGLR